MNFDVGGVALRSGADRTGWIASSATMRAAEAAEADQRMVGVPLDLRRRPNRTCIAVPLAPDACAAGTV
ncbi:hypothetical protein [Sphingomonas gellani]|uniref:hypothetical protein n=1 Tax=Sphingomonas gellani TaxID=1166340 RepID=UPI0014816118|nr:hypothetical protein [Sphingomonas gellani]